MRQGWKKTVVVMLAMVSAALLATITLAACGTAATPTAASLVEAYVSGNLPTGYEGALPAASQLILGTLRLEGTANAVTTEQAKTLLPLCKSLQSGAVQGAAEVNAVLGQIERAMASEQIQAIAAMRLTQEDMASWVQESGMAQRPGGGPGDTPGAGPRGTMGVPPGVTPGAGGAPGGDSSARETMRAGFDSMSEEERAQVMATMQAGGGGPAGGFGGQPGQRGQGGQSGASGQFQFLLTPLIEILTQRAGS